MFGGQQSRGAFREVGGITEIVTGFGVERGGVAKNRNRLGYGLRDDLYNIFREKSLKGLTFV